MRNQTGAGGVLRAAAACLAAAGTALAGEQTAVTGGTVMNASGAPLAGATVLIEDGVIRAVGTDVQVPAEADVLDATGKVVFPGMILAHTSAGLDRANESVSVTPYVDVRDAIEPNAVDYEEALRAGVTTLHVIQGNDTVISGLSRIIAPRGLMVDVMTVRAEVALKVSVSPKRGYNRMTQMAELRRAFDELERHVRDVAEKRYEDEQKKAGKNVLLPPDEAVEEGRKGLKTEDLDQKWQALWRLKNGELALWLNAETAADVLRAIDWAEGMGLLGKAVFVVGTEAFKVVDALQAAGRPVVLSGNLVHREVDPASGEERETFVPKVFADQGVPFVLQTFGGSMGEGFLWYQAARLVREGVPRETALNAITWNAADALGMGAELGTIAPGRHGNLVILSGDPLAQATVVEKVLIRGQVAYDRATDRRLQELLKGEALPEKSGGGD